MYAIHHRIKKYKTSKTQQSVGPGHFGATNSAQDISAQQTRRRPNSAQVKLGAGQTRRRSNSAQVKLGAGQTRRRKKMN